MSLLLVGISMLIACELFLLVPLVKLGRGLLGMGDSVGRTLADSNLSDDDKQSRLLKSAWGIATGSLAILSLILVCLAPVIVVSMVSPETGRLFLDPLAASVIAICSLAYVWLRSKLRV